MELCPSHISKTSLTMACGRGSGSSEPSPPPGCDEVQLKKLVLRVDTATVAAMYQNALHF